jgi:uncharacterized protein (TIGR02271 family)
MIGQNMVDRLYDCEVIDPRGEKIGSVKQVWVDDQTGEPMWASVNTGIFGLSESVVPLQRAELREDAVRVSVDKQRVKDSPRIDASSDQITDNEQAELLRYYGFGPQGSGPEGAGRQQTTPRPGAGQRPGGRRDDEAMTRSEEQLRVGSETVETGRVRLVKHVVTDEQQVNVPVSHEEVRLEREPITEANRAEAMRGASITEAEHEVTLHAEKPVVNKETVPLERVRLAKDEVTDTETVTGKLRKEEIEVEEDGRRDRRKS